MLICDWLLITRTEIWQREKSERSSDEEEFPMKPVFSADLVEFQKDLLSLRKLAGSLKAAMPKVSFVIRTFKKLLSHEESCDFGRYLLMKQLLG